MGIVRSRPRVKVLTLVALMVCLSDFFEFESFFSHLLSVFYCLVPINLSPLTLFLHFPSLSLTLLCFIKRQLLQRPTRTQSDHHNVITRVLDQDHCTSNHKMLTSALIAVLPFPSSLSFLFFPRSLSWVPPPSCKTQDTLSHIVTV
jgi:hypothetical protein